MHRFTQYINRRVITAAVGFAAITVAFILAAAGSAHGQIVLNGDFETPLVPDPPGFTTFTTGQNIGGWTVASGDVDLVSFWQDASGNQSLDLNGTQPGAIFQDLATTPGQEYLLSYAMAGNPFEAGSPAEKQMTVRWGGSDVATPTFNTTGQTSTDMGWKTFQHTVTATSASTRLEFISTTPGGAGPAIDAVSLTAVPEPSTFALLSIGLVPAFGLLRRRRQR